MPIPVTSWSDVPQDDYDAAFALVTQIVAEEHPELHVKAGVIKDIVLRLHGVLGGAGRVERRRFYDSNSLLALRNDPTLADDAIVDANMSNYRIVRNAGGKASGTITIVTSSPTPIVVPSGYIFMSGGRQFVTQASYASRVSASDVIADTDRVMVAHADGTYSFTISVIATEIGAVNQLNAGDTLSLTNPLPYVVRVYATQDFTGGSDAETNADLLDRLETSNSAHTWSNTPNIQALVRGQDGFTNAITSVIRAGDPEMLRDKHGIFPLAYGNRIDLWVKLPQTPTITTITKTATYIGQSADGPIWSMTLTRDDIPGLYLIDNLLREGRVSSAVVAPTSVVRNYSQADGDPDIANALEAAFSRYQSVTVQFVDAADADDDLVVNTTTATYNVTGRCTFAIDSLQDDIAGQQLSPPAGDVVIRGAVPCFMSVEVEVDKKPSNVDDALIGEAIAEYVNATGFVGEIYATRIAGLVQPLLPADVNIGRIRLAGLIYGPDGSEKLYRDREVLVAPDNPAKMITANTVAFYLHPTDVVVNAV